MISRSALGKKAALFKLNVDNLVALRMNSILSWSILQRTYVRFLATPTPSLAVEHLPLLFLAGRRSFAFTQYSSFSFTDPFYYCWAPSDTDSVLPSAFLRAVGLGAILASGEVP